jgi:adenylosuccinate synthase
MTPVPNRNESRAFPFFLSRIKPGPPRDLVYQEELTRMLNEAVPVYHDDAPRAEADWRDQPADVLRAPVTITARGPALTDKTWHPLQGASR